MSSYMPKYLREVLGFSISDVGLYSSLPYLLKWIVSILSGVVSDYIIGRKYLSITNTRKINAAICSIFPATFIVAASYAECDRTLVIIFFTLSTMLNGFYYTSLGVNALDLSPNYSASIVNLFNFLHSILLTINMHIFIPINF